MTLKPLSGWLVLEAGSAGSDCGIKAVCSENCEQSCRAGIALEVQADGPIGTTMGDIWSSVHPEIVGGGSHYVQDRVLHFAVQPFQ